jgi:hypothetical protein
MQARGRKRARNFSSADYRFLMFSVGVCLTRNPTHIYISIYATQPMNEHHSFQPPDLENVISSTISSNVFEYIYTLTRSKWHTRNDGKTARKSSPHIKPYITGHKFPQVTSHLIQLIALFSHFSWFFSFTLHSSPPLSSHSLIQQHQLRKKAVFPSYYFPSTRESFLPSVYMRRSWMKSEMSQRVCSYDVFKLHNGE